MNNQFSSDDEVLARLVREAGDPNVAPDPQYAKTLRATILDRLGQAEIEVADVVPIAVERTRHMKRLAKFAVAATILVALGTLMFWTTFGSSSNLAFADVAKALENLRSATYDFTMEMKNSVNGTTTTVNSKGFFLAPSLERVEMSMSMGSAKDAVGSIMILDCLAAKGITLMPEQKLALKINISTTEKSTGGTASMFETVRRFIREENTGSSEKIEPLGKKEIEGREVVGFRTRNNMADMAFWADPQTARLVRVDIDMLSAGGRGVMTNFRYDMELDPSLFSLEAPTGYTVQTQTVTLPVEEDLINFLRLVAEHNAGTFPTTIAMNNKVFMQAMQAEVKLVSERLLKTPAAQELMAEIKSQYGEDQEGFRKAWMKAWMEMSGPTTQKISQKYMWGVMFYMKLQPENDSHYTGKDVKLGAPDRPILWYKPTGSDSYRVIYADLSVKEMTPDEVKKLPEASPNQNHRQGLWKTTRQTGPDPNVR